MDDFTRWSTILMLWASGFTAVAAAVVFRVTRRRYIGDWSLFYASSAIGYLLLFLAYEFDRTWLVYGFYLFLLIGLYFFAAALLRFSRETVPAYIIPSVVGTITVFMVLAGMFPDVSVDMFYGLSIFIYAMCGLTLYIHEKTWLRHFGLVYLFFAVSLLGYLVIDPSSPVYLWVYVINLTLGLLMAMSLFVMHYFREAIIAKRKTDHLRYLSYHDPLTSLHNRAYLEERVLEIDTADRLPLAMLIADLDNLKQLNDRFGHRHGDMLLAHTADVLKLVLPSEAIITRYGGDEFVMVVPNCPMSEAKKKKKAIVDRCERINIKNMSISISVGIAIKDDKDESIMHIFDRAEEDMYEEKQNRDHH